MLNKKENLIQFVENRPGHDRMYSISSNKLKKELGWNNKYTFEKGIVETVNWYKNNIQ